MTTPNATTINQIQGLKMKRNESSNSASQVSTSIPSIDLADIVLYAPDSKEHPQTKNDKGQVIKGTALASFMGYKNSLIEWTDTKGIDRQQPKLALVFAVKLSNGSFKNIPIKTNYTVAPGSNLESALIALGVTPEYQTIQQDPDDDLFGTITTLNREKLESGLEALKGLAYLVTVENKVSKNNRYYNDIDLETLKPRFDKKGEHQRIAPADKCDVSELKINFNDD